MCSVEQHKLLVTKVLLSPLVSLSARGWIHASIRCRSNVGSVKTETSFQSMCFLHSIDLDSCLQGKHMSQEDKTAIYNDETEFYDKEGLKEVRYQVTSFQSSEPPRSGCQTRAEEADFDKHKCLVWMDCT